MFASPGTAKVNIQKFTVTAVTGPFPIPCMRNTKLVKPAQLFLMKKDKDKDKKDDKKDDKTYSDNAYQPERKKTCTRS